MHLKPGQRYEFLPPVPTMALTLNGIPVGTRMLEQAVFTGLSNGSTVVFEREEVCGEGPLMLRFPVDLAGLFLSIDGRTLLPTPTMSQWFEPVF